MINELFKVDDYFLGEYLNELTYPEEILTNLHDFIIKLGNTLGDDYIRKEGNIWIHKSCEIDESVKIIGPALIMENTKICHNAYLRENVLVLKNCFISNSSEIKNSLLMNNVEVPHFNYVGDSVLGNFSHLGAGVILSNLRLDKKNIKIDGRDTNLTKVGAFIGDNVQIGCNSVIMPGTIVYPNTLIYPLMNVKGIVKENIKNNNIEIKRI